MVIQKGFKTANSLYLPAHYSKELRKFQNEDETLSRNIWPLEDILNFVFPKKYQPTYYNASLAFMRFLEEKERDKSSISNFIKENNISKATFYNRVLPKLKRFGLIKVEREPGTKKMKISISKSFGNYLMKIADSWLAYVDDIRR